MEVIMNRFSRLLKIMDEETLERFKNTHVLLVGVGGVGGTAFETLLRMGIGHITVVDNDTFEESNLNRQILSNYENIGNLKVMEAKKRALLINPECEVIPVPKYLTKENIRGILNDNYDYIIDACDTVTIKLELVKMALELGIKIISVMGTGNKFNPTMLEICDITKTSYDPLAKVMRKLLRDNKIKHLMVVASKEIPRKTDRIPGSSMMVPNTAGIYAAYYCINDIMENNKKCL